MTLHIDHPKWGRCTLRLSPHATRSTAVSSAEITYARRARVEQGSAGSNRPGSPRAARHPRLPEQFGFGHFAAEPGGPVALDSSRRGSREVTCLSAFPGSPRPPRRLPWRPWTVPCTHRATHKASAEAFALLRGGRRSRHRPIGRVAG